MKKFALLSLFLFIFALCSTAFAKIPPAPDKEIFIADYAKMVDDKTRKEIVKMGKTLDKSCGAQIVVVTVNSLDGEPIEDYANKLFRKWGIGSKKNNDGVLLLIAKDDRKFRIEVGYGLEGAITDGLSGEILDSMKESFRAQNYSEGIMGAYSRLNEIVYNEKGIETPEDVQATSAKAKTKDSGFEALAVVFVIIFIFIAIVVMRSRAKNGEGVDMSDVVMLGSMLSSMNSSDSHDSSDDSSFGGGSSGGGGASDDW